MNIPKLRMTITNIKEFRIIPIIFFTEFGSFLPLKEYFTPIIEHVIKAITKTKFNISEKIDWVGFKN